MKTKTILVLSLATNAVLLSALGYIQSQNIVPEKSPAFIRYITNAPTEVVEQPAPTAAAPPESVASAPQL